MPEAADTSRALDVLIVEDNDDARTTMRLILTLVHGHVVHEAVDGASGVRLALELRPQVALIDVGLPDISGHEVARRIRAVLETGDIALVALTGYGSPEDKALAHEAGFDFHLVKPADADELARILTTIAGRRALATRESS